MRIYFRVKAAGRRKTVLELTEGFLPDHTGSLAEAIKHITIAEVQRYNNKEIDQAIFPYLSSREVEAQASAGKVGFQAIYNEDKADEQKAVAEALQAFEDGIYKVLVDDELIENLDDQIELREGAIFTFIRLTLLSGTMF